MSAIALVELASIAAGIRCGDAMVKNAAVDDFYAGTIYPGRYLIFLGGELADVEEAFHAGLQASAAALLDRLILPDPHPRIAPAIGGARRREADDGEALGILETFNAVSAVRAAERGLKSAAVELRELRLADRLGGHAFCIFQGPVADVKEAVECAASEVETGASGRDLLIDRVVIPQVHPEMRENLDAASEFFDLYPSS